MIRHYLMPSDFVVIPFPPSLFSAPRPVVLQLLKEQHWLFQAFPGPQGSSGAG